MPRCKNCKEKFEAKFFNQKFCMLKDECISAFLKVQKELKQKQKDKAWKSRKKVLKEKSKTLGDHKKDLQVIVNACVREIDNGYSCISCGAHGSTDAGHYRGRNAHPELRFNPFNIFLQCRACNGYQGGRPIEYREGMINRYGKEAAEEILDNCEPLHLLRIEHIQEMKGIAREFLKSIKDSDKFSISETLTKRAELWDELKIILK